MGAQLREISNLDLPLNVGRNNLITYIPGNLQGSDILYYEARNNVSFSEPSGPANIVFINKCCGSTQPNNCRGCSGNVSAACELTCDNHGGVRDACGICNGNGNSCKGCDGIPFSAKRFDACGVCGGDGTSCFAPCSGVIDDCGVCNGTNQCCLQYKGVNNKRLDWILLNHSTKIAIQKLQMLDGLLETISNFVTSHNARHHLNEFDLTGVVLPSRLPFELSSHIIDTNDIAQKTDQVVNVLQAFVETLDKQTNQPVHPHNFLHVTY